MAAVKPHVLRQKERGVIKKNFGGGEARMANWSKGGNNEG